MKKTLLIFTLAGIALTSYGQNSFTDDFESYTAGSKLGPQSPNWTTWSAADGGTEDVNVVTTDARSGTKSIYFSSTSTNGGPADVVLPFGGVYNTGTFKFISWFKVPTNKSAYFNFQGSSVIGTTWAMDCYMNADGTFQIGNATNQFISGNYPQAKWFEIRTEINLNANVWSIFIDSVLVGSFSNNINQIASIDYYPANAQASFWVDDVSYEYTPYTLPSLNAGITSFTIPTGIVGQGKTPSVQIRNLGQTNIQSFDLKVKYNNDSIVKNITGLNIASLATYNVNFTELITLAEGTNVASAIISNVNGNANDGDANDDQKTWSLSPVKAAEGKMIFAEEATGTWCQWCPRGAVFMDYMEDNYKKYFAGVAVHNNDPMVYTEYDLAVSQFVPGYPSVIMDRITTIDPSDMEPDFLQKVTTAPVGITRNGATYDPATRTLKVSLSTTLNQDIAGNYKMTCVLTEDSVTGTGSGYNQANAYAGGNFGPMGGYELLANPVPANRMVYDHVARIISPSFTGYENAFGVSADSGQTITHTLTFTLPASWEVQHLNIIGVLIDENNLTSNASKTTVAEAIANGYVNGTEIGGNFVGLEKLSGPDAIRLAPNPSNGTSNVLIDLTKNANVEVEVYSITGALITKKEYGSLQGAYQLPINVSDLNDGIYLVNVKVDGETKTLKLIKQ